MSGRPSAAPTAANSAAGGGEVATTTSGRNSAIAARMARRPVTDHAVLGGNASGWMPSSRRLSGRASAPARLMTWARRRERRAMRGSVDVSSPVVPAGAVTARTAHPCSGRVRTRWRQRVVPPASIGRWDTSRRRRTDEGCVRGIGVGRARRARGAGILAPSARCAGPLACTRVRLLLAIPYFAPAYAFGGSVTVAETVVADTLAAGHK